jgi:TerC family integral membrane protein
MRPVHGRHWRRRRRIDGPVLELAFAPTAAVALVAGLAVELRLFAPGRAPGRREAIVWSAGWLLLALAVAVGIALAGGPAGEWTTVYLIERSLSLDNVFLFSLLLAYFLVPPELRGRVILIGIAGALLLRGLAIAGGVALVESVEAIVYLFGALLLFVAYRALRGADEASDPAANPMLRFVRRLVPTTDDFRGRRLFVREAGRLYGTPLLLVVVAVIAADIAFAVDSIPAAFAVTRDPLVIWTANAFALLGLGSPARPRRDPRAPLPLRRRDDRTRPRVRRDQDPRRRRRPDQRPRFTRRRRGAPRRRDRRLARRGPSRPASSDRGSDATPASLPKGAQYSGIFRAAPDLEQGRASDEDVINSQPRPRRGDGVTHSRTPSSSSDCRSSAGSR